jgi:CRP-like cAMP-binding protein
VKLADSWTSDLFLSPELFLLLLGNSMGVAHEHFEPGQEIFRQGELGDRIYIVSRGKAEVVRSENGREISLALLGPGEYFGEMALLNRTTRNATVRCVEALDVLSIHKREFAVLAATLPTLRENFEKVMTERRVATDYAIAEAAP